MESAYTYDVFISYSRRRLPETFVSQNLVPLLTQWIEEQWERSATFFLDTDAIRTGDVWARTIVNALKSSRVLLAVWTPSYFRSSWCQFEWQTFQERAQAVGTPLSLPLLLADGEFLPPTVRSVQYVDVRSYARVGKAFQDTPTWVEFQGVVETLARDVARLLNLAPPEPAAWPMPEVPRPDPTPQPPSRILLSSVRL